MMLERRDVFTLTLWLTIGRAAVWCAAAGFVVTATALVFVLLR